SPRAPIPGFNLPRRTRNDKNLECAAARRFGSGGTRTSRGPFRLRRPFDIRIQSAAQRRTPHQGMKLFVLSIVLVLAFTAQAQEDTIILDETGVKNLRIETITAEERDFEETAFALGRIETVP